MDAENETLINERKQVEEEIQRVIDMDEEKEAKFNNLYPAEGDTKGEDDEGSEDGEDGTSKPKKVKKDKKFVSAKNIGQLEDKYLDSDQDPDDKILDNISKGKKRRCAIF